LNDAIFFGILNFGGESRAQMQGRGGERERGREVERAGVGREGENEIQRRERMRVDEK